MKPVQDTVQSTKDSRRIIVLGLLVALLLGVHIGKRIAGSGNETIGDSTSDRNEKSIVPLANPTPVPIRERLEQPTPSIGASIGSADSNQSGRFFPRGSLNEGAGKESHLLPLRVHGSDGRLADGYTQWYGDGRESPAEGMSDKQMINWKKYHTPSQEWHVNAFKAALDDPRGIVFGGGHGGLGNQLWQAAGVISVALSTGRLPVLNCGSCYRRESLREVMCIPTVRGVPKVDASVSQAYVGWGEASMPMQVDIAKYQKATEKILHVTGWLQSWYNMQEHWETICWAFQPPLETQQAAQDYFDEILNTANVSISQHTRIVTVHLRRGDYVGKAGVHGLLTLDYYTSGLAMIRSRLTKICPECAAEGMVVVVMTEQENVKWCKENMKWDTTHGVRHSICADAKGKRCNGEVVDMMALALGDFLIIANSTFSWWSHFFGHCRKALSGWWSIVSAIPNKKNSPTEVTVMPHRWYSGRLKNVRPKTFDLVPSNILIPNPKSLFEGIELQ